MRRWVDWVKKDPQPISLHDRLCLEQRDASYAATAELALDLMAPHSMLPGNSGIYQETAFSLPLEWQFASRHHTVLVDRWAPALADLPYNPPLTKRERLLRAGGTVRRRARRVLARMDR